MATANIRRALNNQVLAYARETAEEALDAENYFANERDIPVNGDIVAHCQRVLVACDLLEDWVEERLTNSTETA